MRRFTLQFSRFKNWIGLGVVLLVYLALALITTQVLHFSLALDEGYHLELITFIKQYGRLPITYEERAQMARADLPLLYHVLVAVTSAGVTVGESPHFKYFGDSFRYRAIDHQSGQPYILPTEDFTPPYLGRFQVWQIGRWLSVGLSAATLVVVFFTLQAIPLGPRPLTSLFGTAMLAFIPRYLIVGSALNDDSLLGLSAALYFLMLIQVIKNPTRWFPVIGLGAMLGVTATIKYSLALMPLEIIGVLGFIAVREKWGWRWFLSRLAVVGFLTILCSGWWFGWNIWFFNTVAKDGLIVGTVRALFMGGYNATLNSIGGALSSEQVTGTELPAAHQTDPWSSWFSTTFLNFWGFNIDGKFPLFPWAYLIIGAVLVLVAAGLWQLWRRQSSARGWLLLAGLHFWLLCLIPLLRFATSGRIGQTAQGRHILIPAATVIVALIAWGLATALPRRRQAVVFAVIIAGMIGWTGVHLYQLTYSSRQPLPLRTLPQAAEWLAQPSAAKFGEEVELVSYELDPQPEQGLLRLNLAWRSLAHTKESYLVQVELLDDHNQVVSYGSGYNSQGRLPTLAWDPGDSVFDRLALPLPHLPAGDYTVQVQLVSATGSPLPVREGEDAEKGETPQTTLTLGQFSLSQPSTLVLPERISINDSTGSVEVAFALWQADGPITQPVTSNLQPSTLPTYRYPATISIVTSTSLPDGNTLDLQLVDDKGQTWPATQNQANIYAFVIGPRWQSGGYRLQATLQRGDEIIGQSTGEPLLTVENWWQRRFEAPEVGIPNEANFADQFKFLGYTLSQHQVRAGEAIPLTLYWQALPHRSPQADFIQFNHFVDSAGTLRGGYDRQPLEYYSTLLWAPGEVVIDGYAVPVNADAPPGQYYLNVGYYLTVGEAAVNLPLVVDGQMTNVTSVTIGPIEVVPP